MTKTPIEIMNALDNIESGIGFSTDALLARFFDTTRKTIWEWSKTREEFPNPVIFFKGIFNPLAFKKSNIAF